MARFDTCMLFEILKDDLEDPRNTPDTINSMGYYKLTNYFRRTQEPGYSYDKELIEFLSDETSDFSITFNISFKVNNKYVSEVEFNEFLITVKSIFTDIISEDKHGNIDKLIFEYLYQDFIDNLAAAKEYIWHFKKKIMSNPATLKFYLPILKIFTEAYNATKVISHLIK